MKRLAFLVSSCAVLLVVLKAADTSGNSAFRFGVSETLIAKNVTTAETKQAMMTWGAEIKRQVPSFVAFEVSIPTSNEILKRVRAGDLDGVVVSALEYPSVAAMADGTIMINEASPEGEEYLLLVHKESGINSLADLRSRKITIYDHPKMNVARMWLDMALSTAKLGAPETLFSSVTANTKLNLSVLGVFFRTADACLVPKRSFATMTEMNPQLGVKLRTLATSPKLIPSILVFRKDCPPQHRKEFERALAVLKTAPAGQQALALFDGTGVVRADASIMKSSLELIAAHERLRLRAGGGAAK